MMSKLEIRTCREDDWSSVWPFFREIVTAGETYVYPRDITEEFARTLWLAPPPAHTVVAVNGNGVITGSAKLGPNQMGPGSHVATASFMVDSAARGRGTGRALGEYALQWARDNGFRAMQFNAVVSSNVAAVTLWRAIGFEIVGRVPEAFRRPSGEFADLYVMYQRL